MSAHRFRLSLRLFCTLATLLFLTACTTDATVGCAKIAKLKTGMGLLNVPIVLLGNVIDLDPASHQAGHGLKLTLQTGDVEAAPGPDTTDISDGSALNISFAATLTPTEQVALTSALSENIQLHLENSERRQINQPAAVVNRSGNLTALLAQMRGSPGHRYVIVDAGVLAQNVTFQLKNGTQNSLSLTLPGGKKFDLSVNYTCQGDLSEKVSQANAARTSQTVTFFKIDEIIANGDGTLTTRTFDGDLRDYDLTNAAQ